MRAQKLQKRAERCGAANMNPAQAQDALQKAVDGWAQASDADRQNAAGELLFAAARSLRLEGVDAEEALTFASKRYCEELLTQQECGTQAEGPAPIEHETN